MKLVLLQPSFFDVDDNGVWFRRPLPNGSEPSVQTFPLRNGSELVRVIVRMTTWQAFWWILLGRAKEL